MLRRGSSAAQSQYRHAGHDDAVRHCLCVTVPVWPQAAGQLSERERMELWLHLGHLLAGDGLLPRSLLGKIEHAGKHAMQGSLLQS